jgi:hypothetical protein
MNTYTWSVDLTECYKDRAGFENVIKNVYVACVATNGTTFTKDVSVVDLAEPDPATFIPFEDVTQEIALDWAFNVMGDEKLALQNRLDALIIQIENPETVFLPLTQ